MNYLLSFCGFFPADKPRYSCIVCIQKSGLPASGGGMSGVVFHHISEGIMSQSLKLDVSDAREEGAQFVPGVKAGNLVAADYVLSKLGFEVKNGWEGGNVFGPPVWGTVQAAGGNKLSLAKSATPQKHRVPNVMGMGARDAVYLMECRGIQVKLHGRGKVKSQSIPAGNIAKKGSVCELRLQ
jgi:cell division protein FtsI (penicillin-binding protein 3)